MCIYRDFAYIYDRLMKNVDYNKWVDYIESIFRKHDIKPREIIDLACGTGNVTTILAARGYRVTGVDKSEDMLYVAREKARRLGLDITFVHQDMRNLSLHHAVDAMICMCDGINYILSEAELKSVFNRVYKYLKEEGIFVFDISSYYKLSSILGNNLMADSSEDISFIWQNFYDTKRRICQMNLTFFVKEGDYYRRFDEIHYQRAYRIEEITDVLKESGFKNVEIYHSFTFEPPKKRGQRIFFVALKN